MGILLCSRTFFAIQGVLYPASIVTNLTSGKLFVTWSYTASHAALSLTFPAVTSTPNTKPCLSQAVCASYANCRSCAPFTNIPQSGSVLDTVFSTVPPPELPLFSSSSSSLTFLPSFSRSSDTSLRSCSSYTFAALATCSFCNFFLFADALICVPSIKIMLGSTIRLFSALFKICAKISSLSSGGKRLQKA